MVTIKKDIQRIGWRFSEAVKRNDNSFKINQNDIDALNGIAEYIDKTQKQQFEANHLFAKLYIFCFMRVLEKEGSTVFNNSAKQRIGNILKKPIEQIIEELVVSLNDSEKYDWLENLGIEIKHPALRTEAETIENNKKINEALKENRNIITDPVWNYNDVKDCVISEVNQMINLFK